jgi:hypothetical protein
LKGGESGSDTKPSVFLIIGFTTFNFLPFTAAQECYTPSPRLIPGLERAQENSDVVSKYVI